MNNKQADKINEILKKVIPSVLHYAKDYVNTIDENTGKPYPERKGKEDEVHGITLGEAKEIANLALNSGYKLGKEKAVCSICGKEGLLFCGECRNCDDCESIVKSNENHVIKKAKQELWDDIKGQHDIDPDRYLSECFVCEHEKEIKEKHNLK